MQIVLLTIVALLMSAVPGLCQSGMSFSVYNDANGSWPGGQPTVSGYSTVEDHSWGCEHSDYSTTTWLFSPSGRRSESESSGLYSSTSLLLGGEGGLWDVETEVWFNCSCIGGSQGFSGGGSAFPVNVGTSISCWKWTGQVSYDEAGHTICLYTLPYGNTAPGCAKCVPTPDPVKKKIPRVHWDEYGDCPQLAR